jgi:GNAT superfamily N-acetyltransferase
MTADDITGALQLCRAAGWNQTEGDWRMFIRLSPDGCRAATINERLVGTVATVSYEDRFSWIGMMLVDPAERGKGIGTRLMTEALESLQGMPSIRLDATPAGHGVYRKLGFVEEYRLSRMETTVRSDGLLSGLNPSRRMTIDDLPDLAALDRQVFGADRRVMLDWMIEGAPEYGWVVERGERITGYTFGRHGFNFEHIGPVVAEDQTTARQLLSACLRQQRVKRFILDAAHYEADWRVWLESIGFSEQRPLIRMFYRGNPYPGLPEKQFAILGPEFG